MNVASRKTSAAMLLAGLIFASAGAMAKVSPEEADRLGKDLTPLGAEKAGNDDGTIPEWTGLGIENVPAGYAPGKHHPDPFADDPVLFTITAENVDQYADQLREGHIALFKTYPDTFKMKVYRSRRTFKGPEWLYERTRECATNAYLTQEGNAINDAHACIPFPIPQDGNEAVWNLLLRYQGIYRVENYDAAAPDAKGRYAIDRIKTHNYWPYYDPNKADSKVLYKFVPHLIAPPRQAGDTFLLMDYKNPIETPRQAWRYFAGQRRVRRAPVFAFDTPIPPSQGLQTVDSDGMFVGSPEKYNWELKGKRELYVAYNCYALGVGGIKIKDLTQAGHIDTELPRFELHRILVVEGTLKKGERHIYQRRVLYIDEDSWKGVATDLYDKQGKLWRSNESYFKFFWEADVMAETLSMAYDLNSRRYNLVLVTSGYASPPDYSKPVPPDSFWTPANVRKIGIR